MQVRFNSIGLSIAILLVLVGFTIQNHVESRSLIKDKHDLVLNYKALSDIELRYKRDANTNAAGNTDNKKIVAHGDQQNSRSHSLKIMKSLARRKRANDDIQDKSVQPRSREVDGESSDAHIHEMFEDRAGIRPKPGKIQMTTKFKRQFRSVNKKHLYQN